MQGDRLKKSRIMKQNNCEIGKMGIKTAVGTYFSGASSRLQREGGSADVTLGPDCWRSPDRLAAGPEPIATAPTERIGFLDFVEFQS